MKLFNPQLALKIVYVLLFFFSFGLWHYFQDYSEYLLLTVQWHPAACSQLVTSKNDRLCDGLTTLPTSPSSSWIVHKFQAMKTSSVRTYCDNRYPFIPDQLQADAHLLTKLNEMWPSVVNGTSNRNIWLHEYVKYGVCVTRKRTLRSQNHYFQQAVDTLENINLFQILSDGGIIPSSTTTYSMANVKKTIEDSTKTSVRFQCYKDKSGRQILSQILFCLSPDKDGLINCQHQLPDDVITPNTKWDTSYPEEIQQLISYKACNMNENIVYLPLP